MTKVQVMLNDDVKDGLSIKEIAKKYSIKTEYVKRELKKNRG